MSNTKLDKNKNPLVSIIAGSTSDKEVYEKAEKILKENDIKYELQIISAHRNPDKLDQYIKSVHTSVKMCRHSVPKIRVMSYV